MHSLIPYDACTRVWPSRNKNTRPPSPSGLRDRMLEDLLFPGNRKSGTQVQAASISTRSCQHLPNTIDQRQNIGVGDRRIGRPANSKLCEGDELLARRRVHSILLEAHNGPSTGSSSFRVGIVLMRDVQGTLTNGDDVSSGSATNRPIFVRIDKVETLRFDCQV